MSSHDKFLKKKKKKKKRRVVNPFLFAHIPYAQSEGILPKYELLQ